MTGMTRRRLLQYGAAAGAGMFVPWRLGGSALASTGASPALLDPGTIPMYVRPLVIPPAMPRTSQISGQDAEAVDYYEIAVRQFQQQILPMGRATTVWSYGSVNHPGTFNYPAFTIEARSTVPVRVKWINGLVDGRGGYLSHLLPVDPTLHWANPPGGKDDRDSRPSFASTPGRYTGPVPIVTHLHGGHTAEESDGHPEAWYLPAGAAPPGFAATGSSYDEFKAKFAEGSGVNWEPGTAVFQYDNDQRAATMWYHDHTLGMTRLNVYAGPAGFYLLRGGDGDLAGLPGPAPALGDPAGTAYYEIPIAIQDRTFYADHSLFFPTTREFFDGFGGPYIPDSDISPIWNPEFFGDTIVVNGRSWPYLDVEPRRYRLRFLNGTNGRFLILKLAVNPRATRPVAPVLPFWQIGSEGGFLPAPVKLDQLLIAPAERADVILDFSDLHPGSRIYLINEGPDEPFGGGVPGTDFAPANPRTTGQVMLFRVVSPPRGLTDSSRPVGELVLPAFTPLGPSGSTRQVSLNEADSEILPEVGPSAAFLGTVGADGTGQPLRWMDPPTENVALGATEVWELHNFTEDAHPIHIHEVQFQVVDREALEDGSTRGPESWESGYKDTVIAYPGEITRVKATFDRPGRFVWHCHIVDHEDNEMMRPYTIE
jgi:FtsP/CotA-like multicopper oxidase with cupredoxin domain